MRNRSVHVLFSDGGSRGYPGPGGSGSVLVRVDMDTRAAEIIWAVSMSHAQIDTSNNMAEHWGIIHILRRAEAEPLTPLYVIGDSFLIIEQMRRHQPPHQPRLRQLCLRARPCSNSLEICGWTHHFRAHNKMADLVTTGERY
uniref:RNase H type-1 domain-containing protein n=1 Tax=Peronospora matthiolae TaxID=2874970 RepID=A0AAV1TPE7_9STRA